MSWYHIDQYNTATKPTKFSRTNKNRSTAIISSLTTNAKSKDSKKQEAINVLLFFKVSLFLSSSLTISILVLLFLFVITISEADNILLT